MCGDGRIVWVVIGTTRSSVRSKRKPGVHGSQANEYRLCDTGNGSCLSSLRVDWIGQQVFQIAVLVLFTDAILIGGYSKGS